MRLRRRAKIESELIALVREELAGIRNDVQATMTETAAVLSVRLRSEVEQRVGEPSALASGILGVRDTIAVRDSELAHMLRRVNETCDSLTEQARIDRVERGALVDAISRLTIALAVAKTLAVEPVGTPMPAPAPARRTVLGGTVDPERATVTSQPPATLSEAIEQIESVTTELAIEIDLEAIAREPDRVDPPRSGRPGRPDGVEVRCRFGDRWVTGFEVCEVIRLDDVTRYRLRRRSDGSVIPTLFDEKDLRFFSTTFLDPTTP